ncbi:MAG: hypothetical protein ACRCVN_07460 [Spirochaetia bacterium]
MKRLILLATVCSLPLFATNKTQWQPEHVRIYSDADNARYGIAKRRISIAADIYAFGKGRTLPVNNEFDGYLTAVTASVTVKNNLEKLIQDHRSINIKGRELLRVIHDTQGNELLNTMYVYREVERGIYIGFSLEKAPQGMLDLIELTYARYPTVGQVVKKHYEENYVIRIIQADNFYTRSDPPGMIDIMFAATLIGEKDQQLLGIHDGNDYLADLLNFYEKQRDYDVLKDQFKSDPRSGQA